MIPKCCYVKENQFIMTYGTDFVKIPRYLTNNLKRNYGWTDLYRKKSGHLQGS